MISRDCPNVITLASDLGMEIAQPMIYTQIQTDCCSNALVSCSPTLRVTAIYWFNMNLTGSLNGPALLLLDMLNTLDISDNFVTGNLPQMPSKFQTLFAQNNMLSGPLPYLSISFSMLQVSRNRFTGNLPNFGKSLIAVDISYNQINGTLPSMPSKLRGLYMMNNLLSGELVFPTFLVEGNFKNNLFSGQIPPFPSSLETLALGNNQLCGIVPNLTPYLTSLEIYSNKLSAFSNSTFRISVIKAWDNLISGEYTITGKPLEVVLNSNLITGIVIQNTQYLSNCDLSENPMLGYTNLTLLTMCKQDHLYNLSDPDSVAEYYKFKYATNTTEIEALNSTSPSVFISTKVYSNDSLTAYVPMDTSTTPSVTLFVSKTQEMSATRHSHLLRNNLKF
eukprot:NODE_112_length_18534_cov_1.163656.p6 type:complete len:392 gc:universal NODE_112_length_18534_cov_1.163656:9891-8716(-)